MRVSVNNFLFLAVIQVDVELRYPVKRLGELNSADVFPAQPVRYAILKRRRDGNQYCRKKS